MKRGLKGIHLRLLRQTMQVAVYAPMKRGLKGDLKLVCSNVISA